MAKIYISLGSNIDRETNTRIGVDTLRKRYGGLLLSSVYESEAVGFEGDSFFNMVIALETDEDVFEVATELRSIEEANGRDRKAPKFSSRTLDLDPLEFRIKNALRAGELHPFSTAWSEGREPRPEFGHPTLGRDGARVCLWQWQRIL